MDTKTIDRISREVLRKFPEMAGCAPRITPQAGAKSPGGHATYLLAYTGHRGDAGGHAISRTVRVVADDSGRILKVTTSR
ncbi:MAG: hypothetical protein KIT46_09855 [Anaerolineales bacterium]|nr:hypothetical protein [Anaerolineales bacterium]MCW5856335.1 hypothetical protein [Anaerolineales bacterium]